MKKIIKVMSKIIIVVVIILIILLAIIKMICSRISESTKELLARTMLETGQMKFLASLFLSKEELQELANKNPVETMNTEVDTNLINVENNEEENEINGITLEKISRDTFFAKMLIINDPLRVKLATTYPWKEYGVELDKLVNGNNAVAGINGGLYLSAGNKGGQPLGVVVSNGEIQLNRPDDYVGLHIIGFDENNILRIIDISEKTQSQTEEIIKKEKIRDAVTFQEEISNANNRFVKLIINGEERKVNGKGSGANPRTAIGQRADGTVLLLVTDGRGASGHLGATAADLIKIMKEYGAVNAANLDGGSSSSMYYNGKYEMCSVTFYYANSSWKLPTGFIVE